MSIRMKANLLKEPQNIDDFIDKGGDIKSKIKKECCFVLRLTHEQHSEIKRLIRKRPGVVSMNSWILEAIHEKISRLNSN